MIEDWTTFLLTGASTLPAFMVAFNADALPLAILVFVVLLFAAIFASLADESSPARQGAARRERNDERDR